MFSLGLHTLDKEQMLKEDIIMTLIQIWDEYTSDILFNPSMNEGTGKK